MTEYGKPVVKKKVLNPMLVSTASAQTYSINVHCEITPVEAKG
jgi:hypothetical protein